MFPRLSFTSLSIPPSSLSSSYSELLSTTSVAVAMQTFSKKNNLRDLEDHCSELSVESDTSILGKHPIQETEGKGSHLFRTTRKTRSLSELEHHCSQLSAEWDASPDKKHLIQIIRR